MIPKDFAEKLNSIEDLSIGFEIKTENDNPIILHKVHIKLEEEIINLRKFSEEYLKEKGFNYD